MYFLSGKHHQTYGSPVLIVELIFFHSRPLPKQEGQLEAVYGVYGREFFPLYARQKPKNGKELEAK